MEAQTIPPVQAPIKMVNVAELRLDSLNPRRTDRETDKPQEELLLELYRRFDLDDLLASLAENGYFSEEPLIAIPEIGDDVSVPPYIVVEGNRRLASLKILLEPHHVVRIRQLPEISGYARPRLDPVPVKVYATREEVRPYLGVRHIAGVKPWEALAKAKYVRSLLEQGHSLQDVARRVGSGKRTDVVRRWLLTLYSLEQANQESDEPWDEVDEHFGFSWLYTSLGYRSVREYLGITNEVFSKPGREPIPKESVGFLLQHMNDLYGPPPGHPREAAVKESRHIKDLASIYASGDAITALRTGVSLQVALRKTVAEDAQLLDLLRKASLDLAEANGIAPHHSGNVEAGRLARRCQETALALVETLEK